MTPEGALKLDYTSVRELDKEQMCEFDTTQEIKKTSVVLPFGGREANEPKAESIDKSEDKPSILSFKPQRDNISVGIFTEKQPSKDFIMIMRSHFVNPILESLHLIQPLAGTSAGAAYIADILRNINMMEQRSPSDTFLEILFALYDSLAFEGQWANYSSEHFNSAYDIIKKYAEWSLLKHKDLEKAIMELEDAGFDTTPIPLVIEDDLS